MATGTVRLHRVLRAPPQRVYRAFLDADALATGLMVMPPAEGVRFADSQAGCACFVVAQDGSFKKSAGWNQLV